MLDTEARLRALKAGGCASRHYRRAARRLAHLGATRANVGELIDRLAKRKRHWFNNHVPHDLIRDIRSAIRSRWPGGLEDEKIITVAGHVWRTGDTPEDAIRELRLGRSPQTRTGMVQERNIHDRSRPDAAHGAR